LFRLRLLKSRITPRIITTTAIPPTAPPATAPTLLPEEAERVGMAVVVELEAEAEADDVELEAEAEADDIEVEAGAEADDVELGGNCVPVLTLLYTKLVYCSNTRGSRIGVVKPVYVHATCSMLDVVLSHLSSVTWFGYVYVTQRGPSAPLPIGGFISIYAM
jgi:hypothetical protein